MKSIKPGRGPSAMNAIGAIVAVVFGVFWTGMAISMGAPVFFPLFGLVFILLGIVQAVYHFKNATGKNRFSTFDITDETEEPDPLQEKLFGNNSPETETDFEPESVKFCPYCGAKAGKQFEFCASCGKKLP